MRPLASCRRINLSEPFTGNGDEVILISKPANFAHIIGNPDAHHFAVKAFSERRALLVNTTDVYDGKVKTSTDQVMLEITATGDWAITLE